MSDDDSIDGRQGPVVIILAAGEGSRMKSVQSKILHTIGGHSLLHHVMSAVEGVHPSQVVTVIGCQSEQVRAHLSEIAPGVKIALQERPLGTADAVRAGLTVLQGVSDDTPVIVLYADQPLVQATTLLTMVEKHHRDRDVVTVLADSRSTGLVDEELILDAVLVFDFGPLLNGLAACDDLALEVVVAEAKSAGSQVGVFSTDDHWQTSGVDDRVELAAINAEYNRRQVNHWMRAGVTVIDPATTWIEADVDLSADVTLLPGTTLAGATSVAAGATIGPETTIKDSEVGEGAIITRSTVELAVIGAGSTVGPYARLRPGTQVGQDGTIGTFVETKNAILGDRARLGHLTYLGDASLGEAVDVGASVVFANWDSTNKAVVEIGSGAVIGAGTLVVPPVQIDGQTVVQPGTTIKPSTKKAEADQ